MVHKTGLIVLRAIKYGETSLVVTAFTERFGLETYMVNGVRSSKKGGTKASLYQPAAILEAEVYHNEQKQMQRIKEASWGYLYQQVMGDVVRNNIALFMVELLIKTLKQPEENTDLFAFCEDALINLDGCAPVVAANFPLYFILNLADFFGFKMNPMPPAFSAPQELCLDMQAGNFTTGMPEHPYFLSGENAAITAELLRVMQPHELAQIKLNGAKRRELLLAYLQYYNLHIQDFGQMKTLAVLSEVL